MSGETQKAAVTRALKEFIARRTQRQLLDLMGARLGRDMRLQGRALAPMSPFVDTSAWSLALRRDMPVRVPRPWRYAASWKTAKRSSPQTLTRHSSVTSVVATGSRWALLMRCPLRYASVMI